VAVLRRLRYQIGPMAKKKCNKRKSKRGEAAGEKPLTPELRDAIVKHILVPIAQSSGRPPRNKREAATATGETWDESIQSSCAARWCYPVSARRRTSSLAWMGDSLVLIGDLPRVQRGCLQRRHRRIHPLYLSPSNPRRNGSRESSSGVAMSCSP
jgi:hypothetical protein